MTNGIPDIYMWYGEGNAAMFHSVDEVVKHPLFDGKALIELTNVIDFRINQ